MNKLNLLWAIPLLAVIGFVLIIFLMMEVVILQAAWRRSKVEFVRTLIIMSIGFSVGYLVAGKWL